MSKPHQPPNNKWTIIDTLNWTAGYFESYNIDSPRTSAEIFLAHVLNLKRIDLYLRYDQPLHQEELDKFKQLIKRRVMREPVAYITGKREFWSLDLKVTRDTLIPRPETECLVETALTCFSQFTNKGPYKILDLGTGSGAIILSLAKEKSGHQYFAVDCSVSALKTAMQNTMNNNIEADMFFLAGDWLSGFREVPLFDMIVSNPPYISTKILETLQPEIYLYEPLSALDGGGNGLDCLGRIAGEAFKYLKPGGFLIMEMGYDQKAGMTKIIESVDQYNSIEFIKDYSGHDRVVKVKKK